MLIQNAKAFIDGKFQEKTDLLIRDGRISAIGTGLAAEGEEDCPYTTGWNGWAATCCCPASWTFTSTPSRAWTPCRARKPSAT